MLTGIDHVQLDTGVVAEDTMLLSNTLAAETQAVPQ